MTRDGLRHHITAVVHILLLTLLQIRNIQKTGATILQT